MWFHGYYMDLALQSLEGENEDIPIGAYTLGVLFGENCSVA